MPKTISVALASGFSRSSVHSDAKCSPKCSPEVRRSNAACKVGSRRGGAVTVKLKDAYGPSPRALKALTANVCSPMVRSYSVISKAPPEDARVPPRTVAPVTLQR